MALLHLTDDRPELACLSLIHHIRMVYLIGRQMGEGVTLISSGYETALATKMDLEALGLLNENDAPGTKRFFVSDDLHTFCEMGAIFLKHPLNKKEVELAQIN